MNGKLKVSDELRYRQLSWKDRRDIDKYIAENSDNHKILLERRKLLTEEIKKVVKKYLIDEDLADLCSKYPAAFNVISSVSISGENLGITEKKFGDDKVNISTTIYLEGVPYATEVSNYNSTKSIDADLLSKVPEKELQVIRDLAYSTIESSYELEKDLRNEEGIEISDSIETFNHLYKYDEELYKHIVIKNYGEDFLVYDSSDSKEDDAATPNLGVVKAKNMNKNKEILEKLQTIIDL